MGRMLKTSLCRTRSIPFARTGGLPVLVTGVPIVNLIV